MTLNHTQRTFIAEIKEKIRLAQYEALKAVNTNLITLYWDIGRDISERHGESWGQSIVPVLSAELQKEFPGVSGFSERNLWLMAQFYTEYHNVECRIQPASATPPHLAKTSAGVLYPKHFIGVELILLTTLCISFWLVKAKSYFFG